MVLKKNLLLKEHLKNNFFSILDEEGPLINLRLKDFKNRCSNKVLSLCNYYFTWGNEDKKLIKKYTNTKCDILNFGHPKFDLILKKMICLSLKKNLLEKKI